MAKLKLFQKQIKVKYNQLQININYLLEKFEDLYGKNYKIIEGATICNHSALRRMFKKKVK